METNNENVRRYETKTQLALAYCPAVGENSARKTLGRWIKHNRELSEKLKATNYNKMQRLLTPQQERLIIEYLGEP